MARIVYAANALANLQRTFDSLDTRAPDAAAAAVGAITSAVEMLAHHPLIGRMIREDLRELVISFGRTGYVALYRYLPARDLVRVLAFRHHRELDYPE